MAGWIKIHRSITEWGWYNDIPTKILFFHLLLSANYRDAEFIGFPIKRGQLATGLPSLSEKTGLSIQQIRTAFKKLKSTGEVTVRRTPKFSVITVLNYHQYQSINLESTDEQQSTNSLPTDDQQESNNKSKKNKKKRTKKEEQLIGLDFELFWEKTDFPKRPQDAKGEMKKKFSKLVEQGVSKENILLASNIYAQENRCNEFTIGMRKFLDKDTVESYLKGEIVQPRTNLDSNMASLDQALSANEVIYRREQ